MEIEGVRGPCVVNLAEGQKSQRAQSFPTDRLKESGSCYEHQGAPTERSE